ncbi:MAG: MarR family winged helix-turn-helix transcriptional regulator [Mycobacterium sp.]|uniref:MarR family winged helix-turn-helix transcriptional regulator n=1 Tax=Mycobacterium sp. TaxID=1785 RepID=UPI0026387C04|nr:MarR family winged helix-turn-helix transcriptional regulator [Mycobacterium sp.]MDI3314074.1 MarR family winged helix-turn-helix transcriptional regulator [Mycobacterium sp.]
MPDSDAVDDKLLAALERIGQALRVQLWDTAKHHGLSPTQLQVLLRLGADAPERRRVGTLADELDVTHPTVSDAVVVLQRKGFVTRETATRRSPVALTAEGRSCVAAVAGWADRTRGALAELSAADKEHTLRLAMELIAALQRRGVITVARMCVTCRFFRPDVHLDSRRRHHCALLDTPLGETELRVHCPDHETRATG